MRAREVGASIGPMTLATLRSRALSGMSAPLVDVEVHLAGGLPSFHIVGLAETEVQESKDRVRAAILNSRFEFPARRITVNLAPAELPKESGRFDLPIALGILVASEQLPRARVDDDEYAGELSLSGALRPVRGALAMALAIARERRDDGGRRRGFVLPWESAAEASLVPDAAIRGAHSLLEVCAHVTGLAPLDRASPSAATPSAPSLDLVDVKGQAHARRALEIAAAGGHSLLMIGPPGTGKSMLAARLSSILPPMTDDEALESAALASLAGRFDPSQWRRRPYRAPHHTASAVALVGGGSVPRPGEISLAHHGVLFLDELPEFDRRALEVLREPLETGRITISRATRQADFPARFQLVAAMNPCPCGNLGHPRRHCRCNEAAIARYRDRLSGPLLDRIDLGIEVPALDAEELASARASEASGVVAARTAAARASQLQRQGCANAALDATSLDRLAANDDALALLRQAMVRLAWSARAYHRVLKVARTIADLGASETIDAPHVAEAIGYRREMHARRAIP